MGRNVDTQERLVEAAAGLWHARSYADVGVNEICEVADVRKGSFYHFFASKQELAVAVIDRHWRDVARAGRDARARGGQQPARAARAAPRSASPRRWAGSPTSSDSCPDARSAT